MNINKNTACFNCTHYTAIGFINGHYNIGYCVLSGAGEWGSNTVQWDKTSCVGHELSQTKHDEYLDKGNTVTGV